MQLSKIKIGKTVNYTARTRSGRGRVIEIEKAANGDWITVDDKQRGHVVKLRPSQITS